MKRSFQLLAFLLALAMLVTALTACPSSEKDDGTTESETSTEEETTAGEPKIQAEELHIIEKVTDETHEYKATGKGKDGNTYGTDYQIVYSAVTTPEEFAFVKQLRDNIKSATGVMIPLRIDDEFDDEPETLRQDKEIVIGAKTNRKNEYTESFDYQKGYSIFVSYDRLVILTGSTYGISAAVNDFIKEQFGQDPRAGEISKAASSEWTVKSTYRKDFLCTSEQFPALGADLNDYQIAYDGNGNLCKRAAFALQDALSAAFDITVPISGYSPSDEAGAKEFVLEADGTLTGGKYRIDVGQTGYRITVRAADYYGFDAAARYFSSHKNNLGVIPQIEPGASVSGVFTESLTAFEESDRYAFDKSGDVRVMFCNVLFGNSFSNDTSAYDVPTGDRNLLQIETFKLYQPDVLGCQEFNVSKRQNAKLHLDDPGTVVDLAVLLEQNGFKETIDPRVHNALPYDSTKNMTVVDPTLGEIRYSFDPDKQLNLMTLTDPILGEITYTSYTIGPRQGYNVSVDGVNYYQTQYNCVPLFYNTATTDYLDGAYYLFQNHLDDIKTQSDTSKALTWGLFRDQATQNEYLVINTHIHTQSKAIGALQAMEVIDYVEGLAKKYPDIPMFVGGDMNGALKNGYNMQIFIETLDYENETVKQELIDKPQDDHCVYNFADAALEKYRDHIDFIDLQNYGLGGLEYTTFDPARSNGMIFASNMETDHGYPDFDKARGMQPASNNFVRSGRMSVDHILAVRCDKGQLLTFCVVIDSYTQSSSDHLPIFADYSFTKAE